MLVELHNMNVDEGILALAVYFKPKLNRKFSHLSIPSILNHFRPIFGSFMRDRNYARSKDKLMESMARFLEA